MMPLKKIFGQLAIEKPLAVTRFEREVGQSAYIQISHLNSPSVFETKDGAQGVVIQVEGTPFEVEDDETLNYLQANLSQLWQSLDDEFAVYITTHRHPQTAYPKGEFKEGFANDFNDAYRQKFVNKPFFVNDIYITLMIKGSTNALKKGIQLLQHVSHQKEQQQANARRKKQAKKLNNALQQVLASLQPYNRRLLKNKVVDGIIVSDVISFFSLLVNIESKELTLPLEDIASFIPSKRLFVGYDTLHLRGNTADDNQFAAILSVKHYSPFTQPGMLNRLLTVPFNYITTHSYISLAKTSAQELISKQKARLSSVEDAGFSEREALDQALDDVISNRINFGLHHNTVLVTGTSKEQLEERVAMITRLYQECRLVAVRETLNLHNAFFAQVPGNFSAIRRQAPISSHNFSSFCSLHNYYNGFIDKNHLGSALMLVETQSKTPLYLNLHEKGSGKADDMTKGFTTLIAPAGSGKTALMMALDAQFNKHNIKSYIIDRNYGCEIYVAAMQGTYLKFIPTENTGMNPCQLDDTPVNRAFLGKWLRSLVENVALTAGDELQIDDVVDRNFTLPFEQRNLSSIASFFKTTFSGFDALSRWLKTPGRTGKAGSLAWVFDNATDTLNLNADTIGFDMTYLLDQTGDGDIVTSVNMYLFHRIEQGLDGRLTGVFIDEGWQILNNPYWQAKVQEYIFNWRKVNGFIVFSTQSPEKVANSVLGDALIQGAATQIYMANPKAQAKDYIDSFKLTLREYALIKVPLQKLEIALC
jgi:type IV secretion system protein VirB4